jgi:hypothetical protein
MDDYTRHPNDHDILLALDREVPAPRRADVEAHLSDCPLCRTRRDRFSAVTEVLAARSRCDAVDGDEIGRSKARLRSKLAEAADLRRPWRTRLSPVPASGSRWLAAAAMAALLLVPAAGLWKWDRLQSAIAAGEDGTLPIASLTPGATWNVTAEDVCSPGTREYRPVSEAVRVEVLHAYGMETVPRGDYELDYLVTPELGGAPDARNLWPQLYASRRWNAHVKDRLEQLLPRLICDGTVELETAQREIAADWIAAYKKYFKTDVPLRSHASASTDLGLDGPDDDAIVYPIWRSRRASSLELVAFSAAR